MAVRRAAVAGSFYPQSSDQLKEKIEECFLHPAGPGKLPPNMESKEKIFGAVMPHAGYMYSGPVAANGYYALSSMSPPHLIILLGPNHWGRGSAVAAYPQGFWETPLGRVEVDVQAARELSSYSGIVDLDEYAHKQDHCLEVQIPFLQYIYGSGVKILPILLAIQDRSTAQEVGRAVAKVAGERSTLLLASSDFTHYEPHGVAYKKDSELIKTILAMDLTSFYTTLERLNVSACGYGAIASVITAVKILGAKEGRLLKYATSGDITGDKEKVVGYSSIIFI